MNTVVKTTKGFIEGIEGRGCVIFKNVPYAKAPEGELRWKRPVEMDPWEGVKPCKEFGNVTVQSMPGNEQPWELLYYKEFYGYPEYHRTMSEDCLNLNIWTPAESADTKLPVAFWIHGGGFGGGYSSEIEFDGEAYAERGVILVTIEYRCGALGFLAHPWLDAENEEGISGNYGIFDQIEALKWVRDNIAAFGGDPDNITVFGQSAGCMSTQVLVSSSMTEGMIAKAILMSGVQAEERFVATPTLAEEENYGKRFAEIAGVKSLSEMRALPAETVLKCKNQLDGEIMQRVMSGEDKEGGDFLRIVPNVDGVLLKKNVRDVYKAGAMHRIPYMAGCVTDDLGTTDEDRAMGVPGMLLTASEVFCQKSKSAGGPDAYCYVMTRELPDEDGKSVPAFHSAELWYTFGTLGRCWRPMEERDYALSREMLDAWTNFMKTGNPNGGACEGWRPCTADDPYVRNFS